jgi:PEP-CTERM motif
MKKTRHAMATRFARFLALLLLLAGMATPAGASLIVVRDDSRVFVQEIQGGYETSPVEEWGSNAAVQSYDLSASLATEFAANSITVEGRAAVPSFPCVYEWCSGYRASAILDVTFEVTEPTTFVLSGLARYGHAWLGAVRFDAEGYRRVDPLYMPALYAGTDLTLTGVLVPGRLYALDVWTMAYSWAEESEGHATDHVLLDFALVPEPSTLALVALGLALGCAWRRR